MDIASVNHAGQVLPAMPETQNANWLAQDRELIQTVKGISATELFGQDSELTFAVDRDTKRPVVRILNRKTQQVMLQVPPEYILQLSQELGKRPGT
ncbi:MAG: flagellar protein FlaG [Bryobacteraceae bacterium]|jgi:uncharacterized FlaG/YvyC family protein